MIITAAAVTDLTAWSFERYQTMHPEAVKWDGKDLVNTPATAHFAAVLRSTPDHRQVVIWADAMPLTTICACAEHKALASLMCAWDDRMERFSKVAHADGSNCSGSPMADFAHCSTLSYCPTCGHHDTLTTKQEAYGDRTTCTTPDCTYSTYYSIGD